MSANPIRLAPTPSCFDRDVTPADLDDDIYRPDRVVPDRSLVARDRLHRLSRRHLFPLCVGIT